ncbi:hypothetical protein OIU76_001906 [Salix suchowensis]|nr:hypothetical protein OIU76_001906 [Salix suchowensis]
MRSLSEQSAVVVEGAGDSVDKEKKKYRRRSNRRSKRNSPNTASSQPNEPRGESSLSVGNGGKTKCYTSSMGCSSSRRMELDANPTREHGPATASGIIYSSMPTMHANEQLKDVVSSGRGGSMLAKPCPEPIVGGGLNGKSLPFHQFEGPAQSKFFAPYWSMETVNEALEAYCKIEGVPTDVLISGIAAQNRAVEGDVVVIKVDPLSFWTKMKASKGVDLHLKANRKTSGSRQGKSKLNTDCKYADFGNSLVPQKGFYCEYSSCAGEDVHDELNGPVGCNYANGYHQSSSDSSHVAPSKGQGEVLNAVGRMCLMISSYPSKRPTCRVVAIIEKSPRRDAIVGFLNVKQWFYYREGCKKRCKKEQELAINLKLATDLDDALSVQRLPNGLVRVGVHISDVSYFVLPDTTLDIEAQLRSTSVYMLQRKVPMLPPLLSEDIGSLKPGVDRLAFSIFWNLNSSGNVVDRWIGRTVIRSCCQLSYEHAQDIVDGMIDAETCNNFRDDLPQLHGHFEWADVIGSMKCLHEISKTLREKRFDDGALQLESSNFVFLFDEHGIPYDNTLRERKDSNFLVEEFMILANRTAAEIISRAFPDSALLRRHPEPNIQKLREFEAFCCKHGLELDTSSGNFHRSLEHIEEKLKDDSVLFNILINYATRPMQLATYFCSGDLKDMNDWGHYALAVPLYTHFTSPLRRYPDIVVHRTLAAAIEAEQLYMMNRRMSHKVRPGEEVTRCFTGISFLKEAAVSSEGREALSAAALKHRIPCTELLTDIAAYSNERKLASRHVKEASRHVKDACDNLYMWVSVKKKEVLLSDAIVLGLGPRFMTIYIHKLAIEKRIYYDEVDGLTSEWLEATSTLVLNTCASKWPVRRAGPGYYRALDEVAWIINPCDHNLEPDMESTQGMWCSAAF